MIPVRECVIEQEELRCAVKVALAIYRNPEDTSPESEMLEQPTETASVSAEHIWLVC